MAGPEVGVMRVEQLSFDDVPRARATDPATSHDAARITRRAASANCQRVLAYLLAIWPEGATDFQIADALNGRQTSLGCRRKDLCRAGLVAYAGFDRPAPSGANARVWVAVRETVETRAL